MARSGGAAPVARWVSASEIGEYTYCPRAWWYHGHPPPGAPRGEMLERQEWGTRFHEADLRATRRRDEWSGALVLAAIVSFVVLVLAGIVLYLGR
ncbi:MAG TPA: hypothetical protein VEY07_07700 [Thermoplasmata archaeon]|nr:hypothetical protein [Thermoplasmata archaeon]